MKLVVLFFALLGASYALVPGMQYEYQYEGQVKIGMPEIRSRVAGGAIRCTVSLQVHDRENVAIKLSNVEVGEYKGDVDCEVRDAMPVKYEAVSGNAKSLENVYIIHPSREEGEVMEASHKEEVWITNVKKSIAHLFLVEPIRNNFARTSPTLMEISSYGHSTIDEPSLFGYCSSEYSMVPLNNTHRQPAVERRHSAYPHPWTNYEMSRTINFDNCSVSVNTKQTAMGNGSESHLTQFGDVQSRHSLMRHNLTYDGEYYILQNGTNEGHFSVNPFGVQTDKIVSVSNQTYHLKSVSRIQQKYIVPTPVRILDTWHMDLSSAFSPDRRSPNYIRYQYINDARYEPFSDEQIWTGINVYNYLDNIKKNLDRALSDAADIILREEKPSAEHQIGPFSSDSALLTSELEIATRAARTLTHDALAELFDNYEKDSSEKSQLKLRLLIDTFGAGGTGAPMKVFLEKLSQGKISLQRAASVFFSMPNNMMATPLIREFKDFIKSLDLDYAPFSTAIIWINYARTINKVCVNPRRYQHTVPHHVYGREHCIEKEAVDIVLPFFEEKLRRADEDWKQIILIHAIGNTGSRRAFSVLNTFVQDETLNSTVRVAAVYALGDKFIDHSHRRNALRTLMSVSRNRTDNVFVRQACIVAILSWKPTRSWYQTLASDSWRENSNQMSSFIYFILKSYAESSDPAIAEQSQVARFFLPLTKPYAPSTRYSYSRLISIYDSNVDIVTDFDISSLRAGRYADSVPRQVFAFLVNSFGGYRFSVAQSSVSYDAREVHSILHKMSQFTTKQHKSGESEKPAPKRRSQLAIQDVQERMNLKLNSDSLSTYYFNLFDDMEILLPLNKDSLSKAFGHDASLLLNELQSSSVNYTKFINPGHLSLAVPSELGVPLISRFTLPTFTGGPVSDPVLTCDGRRCSSISQLVRSQKVRYDVRTNYRFASKAVTSVRVLMPWSVRTALCATEALKGSNLPVKFSIAIDRQSKRQNVSVSIIPTYKDEFTPVQFHTVPMVILKHIFPVEAPAEIHVLPISSKGTGEGVENTHTPVNESFTGISGKLRYEGDASYPFTQGNIISLIRQPNRIPSLLSSPTCRMHAASLVVNFGKSATKEIHSSNSFNMNTMEPSPLKRLYANLPSFLCISTLLLNGTETRYFETRVRNALVAGHESKSKTNFTVEYRRSALPHFDSNPAGYCASVTREGPPISSFKELRECFKSSQNSEVVFSGDVKGGSGARACEEKSIVSFSASLKISDERRNKLSKELESVCSYDPHNPTVTFVTAPVYDRLKIDISYQEPVPRAFQNATYQVYDVIRGMSFPHNSFSYLDQDKNPKDKISIRGDRYVSEKRWKLEAQMPTETSRFDNVKMPRIIEDVVPLGGINPDLSDSKFDSPKFFFESKLSNECVITKNKVRVFDGFSYSYNSEFCDTTAVKDTREGKKDSPSLKTGIEKETNKFKALIGFREIGTTVLISSSTMFINNAVVGLTDKPTTIRNANGVTLGEALRTPEYIKVIVPESFNVKIYDTKVVVTPYESMRGYYQGLCAAYDGATHQELIGPKRCIYTDPQLFGYAFTNYLGVGCEYQHYKYIKEKVEKFQKNCKKVPKDKE